MPQLVPAIAAIGAAASAATAWLGSGTILAGIAKIGLGIAAKYALGALIQPKPTATSVKLETSYGEDRPREVVLGTIGTAGQHIFRNTNGTGNKRVLDVHVLSHFRITGVTRVRNLGEWTTLGEENPKGRGKFVDGQDADFYIHVYDGTQTVADPVLISSANPAGRWTSAHKGIGIAYAIADQELHREDMPRVWEPFFEVVGPALYDWRKDSSVGGSGSDRWDNQDSWSGSVDNPVLQMYALERGIYNGTELMVGKGALASRLPLAEWTAAANICDEIVSGKKRYTSSIIAAAGEGITHDQNMQPLLEACAAAWVEDATGEYPIVGAVQSSMVTFTDDDLVPDEPLRFSAKRTRSELVNTVSGTWRDPEQFYEAVPFKTRIDATALAADRERLASSIPYGAVNVVEVADRLADIAIRASRYQANAEVCLPPRFLDKAKAGRWVRWNSAAYGDRYYQVLEKRLGPIGPRNFRNVYLSLQEVAEGVFDPTEYVTVPVVPTPPGEPTYASEATGFGATAVGVSTSVAGEIIPGLRFAWSAFTDVTVVAIEIEYRPVGATNSIIKVANVPALTLVTTEGVLASTAYEYRHRLITSPVRTTFPTEWTEITTSAASLPDVSVRLASIAADLRAVITNLHTVQDEFSATMEQIALSVAEGAGTVAEESNISVRFRDAIAVALTGSTASIEDTGDGLRALVEAFTAVQATVGDLSAEGLWRMTAEAGTGDVVARVVLQVRATTGDDWVSAGTIWEAGFTGGDPGSPFARIVNIADQFIVTDGSDDSLPLVFEDGVLKLQNIVVGKAVIPFGEFVQHGRRTGSFTITNPVSDGVLVERTLDSWSIDNESPSPVQFFLTGQLLATQTGSGTLTASVYIKNTTTNTILITIFQFVSATSGNINQVINYPMIESNPAQGTNNYELCAIVGEAGSTGTIAFSFNSHANNYVWWRR